MAAAAKAAGIWRKTHYRWLKDQSYAEEFQDAQEEFRDRIRAEIRRRAIDGWDEPVVYQGVLTGAVVRKYSDRMLELMAKAYCPEFRDQVEHKGRLTLEQILGGG